MIQVILNGESRQFPAALTFEQLLAEMALAGKRIAIERNGAIVPKSTYAASRLADGDRLEVVIAVGGG